MNYLDPSEIASWHAHVYFDAASRDAAWALREEVTRRFADLEQIGRFHEQPVGPHPLWSFQIAFDAVHLNELVSWLALNRGALDVLVHPNTSDELRDHRDSALWIGHSHALNLHAFDD